MRAHIRKKSIINFNQTLWNTFGSGSERREKKTKINYIFHYHVWLICHMVYHIYSLLMLCCFLLIYLFSIIFNLFCIFHRCLFIIFFTYILKWMNQCFNLRQNWAQIKYIKVWITQVITGYYGHHLTVVYRTECEFR